MRISLLLMTIITLSTSLHGMERDIFGTERDIFIECRNQLLAIGTIIESKKNVDLDQTALKDQKTLNAQLFYSFLHHLGDRSDIVCDYIAHLIKSGADVNTRDDTWGSVFTDRTVLALAIATRCNRCVLALKDNEVDVTNKPSIKEKLTYIDVALRAKNYDAIAILSDAGACVNQEDEYGKTPLYYEVQKGCLEGVKALLNSNAFISVEIVDCATKLPHTADNAQIINHIQNPYQYQRCLVCGECQKDLQCRLYHAYLCGKSNQTTFICKNCYKNLGGSFL